jgi:hypothetical protein
VPCGAWNREVFGHLCLVARKSEPPLPSRWSLLIGTGYNCRRPLRLCTELPVLSQLEHGVRRGDPPAPAFVLLAVLSGAEVGMVGSAGLKSLTPGPQPL